MYYNGAFVYYNTEEVNGKEQLPLPRAARQCSKNSRKKTTIRPNSIHIHSYLGTHHRCDYFLYYGTRKHEIKGTEDKCFLGIYDGKKMCPFRHHNYYSPLCRGLVIHHKAL